ncbi:hypothetical protein CALVIDRAFT_594901 [Calocera viscosa TUFC12733]|uniref:N-acetyltransferase domain-containing protein n=1 Tax=Calocera viscosa (strain TUFC12733) TaxID=1330018 RepID=A0A167RA67_CALVF|nr:hypothetical protein CALVIDRAFT_594901 [Calocera viscosa TUFC12733]
MAPPSAPDGARVRALTAADLLPLSYAEARAFRTDATMNWFGNVQSIIPASPAQGSKAAYCWESLRLFMWGLTGATFYHPDGVADVVVRPPTEEEAQDGGRKGLGVDMSSVVSVKEGKEKLCACAMWLPADKEIDGWWLSLRSGWWRSWFRWDRVGHQRMNNQYTPACHKVFVREFEQRGLKLANALYLLNINVDPVDQGKGYTTLLMNAAFERWPGAPMILEASSEKSRDVYAHFGFEIVETIAFSKGEVTSKGIPPVDGEEAEGMTLWFMVNGQVVTDK